MKVQLCVCNILCAVILIKQLLHLSTFVYLLTFETKNREDVEFVKTTVKGGMW